MPFIETNARSQTRNVYVGQQRPTIVVVVVVVVVVVRGLTKRQFLTVFEKSKTISIDHQTKDISFFEATGGIDVGSAAAIHVLVCCGQGA